MTKPIITIFCDGSYSLKTGMGSYGAVIICNNRHSGLAGTSVESPTTSQRMEIWAAIHALEALPEPSKVYLYSDSRYLVRGAQKEPNPNKANYDLWCKLAAVASRHKVTYSWIRGHNGNPYQEGADRLANEIRQ